MRVTSRTLRQVRVPEVQIPQPDKPSIAQRSTPVVVLWSEEPGGSTRPISGRKEGKRQERSRWSERSGEDHARAHAQVSEIGAATACEPEPQTIHITEKSKNNQSSRSSRPTTALCGTHQARSCSQSWTCWTLLSACWR